MLKEFKVFVLKGNVVDFAVALIIGLALVKVMNSLVNDLVMPLIGILLGGRDFNSLAWTFKDAAITYGAFIQNVIDFLIIAFSVFLAIKVLNNLKEKEPVIKEEPSLPSKEEVLLAEIRDLLKQKQG